MKRIFACLMVLALAISVNAAPTISNLKVEPISPWKVKLEFNVSGATSDVFFGVTAQDKTIGTKYTSYENATSGLSGNYTCANGSHTVYWDMSADGHKVKSSNAIFTVSYFDTMYCSIDLFGGPSATSYPVTYFCEIPGGSWANEYKTTKLVLKRLPAGTYKMQNSSNVTLTKPFYIGVFEVTQKQWSLVMGSDPCSSTSYGKGDNYPAHYVSYNMIRGSTNGAKWPSSSSVDSSSFLGKLQTKTGLNFDLPTEAQWEYACRAGTTTTYSYGDSANGNYMWYNGNSSSKTHTVGTKTANPWGLYDMHGNVWEWCLDWYSSSLSYGTDPKGSSSGSDRVERGGSWIINASYCTSSYRNRNYPSITSNLLGFRLSRTLP